MQKIYDTTTAKGKLQIINAYRQAVESSPNLSFKSFCDDECIDCYGLLMHWSNRHNISLKDIRRQTGPVHAQECPTFIQVRPRQQSVFPIMGKVSITFPDGINLTLQETGVQEVIALLEAYQSRHQAEGGAASCSL